jgi:hypothetical protein
MNRVLGYGTLGAGSLYCITGIFGIVTFAACGAAGYPMNYSKDPPVPWTYDDILK